MTKSALTSIVRHAGVATLVRIHDLFVLINIISRQRWFDSVNHISIYWGALLQLVSRARPLFFVYVVVLRESGAWDYTTVSWDKADIGSSAISYYWYHIYPTYWYSIVIIYSLTIKISHTYSSTLLYLQYL